MHYLITGGNGFIGRNLISKLLTDKHTVTIMDSDSDSNPFCITKDITCGPLPEFHADILVHLAADVDVRESILHPTYYINRNILGTLNALELARSCHYKHFIFASSVGAPASESPYSASKIACEFICNAYRESYGLSISVLRLSNVYGPHSLTKGSVIAKFIKQILDNEPITIIGDGDQTRDFVYTSDVSNAIANANRDLITVASGKSYSVNNLAMMLSTIASELAGLKVKIEYSDPIKGELRNSECRTDIFLTVPLKEGLTKTFQWFLDHYER